MRFGIHVSIAGGLHQGLSRAVEAGCDTTQFFLINPRSWGYTARTDEDVERFFIVLKTEANKISPLAVHMPYLPNLASLDNDLFKKSIDSLHMHLQCCDRLKIDYLVSHMGKSMHADKLKRMLEGILRAYNDKSYNVCLLLENTAGQGTEIGSHIPDLSEFYAMIPKGISKGICLDTCHAFAAGYNIKTKYGIKKLIDEFEKYIGFSEVKLLHLNDSLKPRGSRIDRHARIGEGEIGLGGFKRLFSTKQIKHLPAILEVPRTCLEDDLKQLSLVRSLSTNKRK